MARRRCSKGTKRKDLCRIFEGAFSLPRLANYSPFSVTAKSKTSANRREDAPRNLLQVPPPAITRVRASRCNYSLAYRTKNIQAPSRIWSSSETSSPSLCKSSPMHSVSYKCWYSAHGSTSQVEYGSSAHQLLFPTLASGQLCQYKAWIPLFRRQGSSASA